MENEEKTPIEQNETQIDESKLSSEQMLALEQARAARAQAEVRSRELEADSLKL
jgi:hypothetical protein